MTDEATDATATEAAPTSGAASAGVGDDAEGSAWHPLRAYRVARVRARSNPTFDFTWRLVVLAVGAVLLVAGAAMLVLPGPGWAMLFVAFAVLASEFAWARRLLDRTRVKAQQARALAMDPANRRRTRLAALAATVVVVAAGVVYYQRYGFGGPLAELMRTFTN
jgi:uncharacterized protein (TIGR02611 family)